MSADISAIDRLSFLLRHRGMQAPRRGVWKRKCGLSIEHLLRLSSGQGWLLKERWCGVAATKRKRRHK
jgi:hypothetical protein